MAIVPTAKTLFLCDSYTSIGGKVDLSGIFHAIRPIAGYPHLRAPFWIFAQLINGLGKVPFWIDIRQSATGECVHTFGPDVLFFQDRMSIVRLAVSISQCRFPQAGLYLVELFCDNSWVADT